MFGLAFVLAGAALLAIAVVLPIILLRRHGRVPRGRAVKWLGFGIITAFSLIGGLFIAGEAFDVPGAAAAIPMVLAWLVPLLLLVALVVFAARWATWVLAGLAVVTVVLSVWFAVDPTSWRAVEDEVGPVRAIAVFVLAAALGVLGLKRTALAGWLLVGVGLVPMIISGLRGVSGTVSLSVVSVIPVIAGVLYLVSAQLTRGSTTPHAGRPLPPVPRRFAGRPASSSPTRT